MDYYHAPYMTKKIIMVHVQLVTLYALFLYIEQIDPFTRHFSDNSYLLLLFDSKYLSGLIFALAAHNNNITKLVSLGLCGTQLVRIE